MHTDINGSGLLDLIDEHTSVTLRGYIDSRDLITARDEAKAELDRKRQLTEVEAEADHQEGAVTPAECEALIEGVDEIEREAGHGDWSYGTTFIAESEWEDYARELAEDIGAIPSDLSWPACHIDWEAAADALRMDYMAVEIDGETYLCRA